MSKPASHTTTAMANEPFPLCSDASVTAARMAQTRERADVLRLLPPAGRQQLVNAFLAEDADVGRRTLPPWQDLQRQEHYHVDEIALAAIRICYGTAAGLTPRQCSDLECGATYLVRRMQPAFVQAAREHAANALLSCAEFQVATMGRSKAEQMVIALRIVSGVWASFQAVLEAHTPLFPALYLKAEQAQGGGR